MNDLTAQAEAWAESGRSMQEEVPARRQPLPWRSVMRGDGMAIRSGIFAPGLPLTTTFQFSTGTRWYQINACIMFSAGIAGRTIIVRLRILRRAAPSISKVKF